MKIFRCRHCGFEKELNIKILKVKACPKCGATAFYPVKWDAKDSSSELANN